MKRTKGKGIETTNMNCSKCGTEVKNVDSGAASVRCYRCVAKDLNPSIIFLDEFKEDGRRENTGT
jgi:NAD-dependent SIR2 family protein deacetylase